MHGMIPVISPMPPELPPRKGHRGPYEKIMEGAKRGQRERGKVGGQGKPYRKEVKKKVKRWYITTTVLKKHGITQ